MSEENRRKFKRVSFGADFEVKTETWSDPSAKGLDISLNGCRFNCEQSLTEDDTVSLNFSPGFVLRGNVRWCWPIEWYYLAAVHFENISEIEQEQLKSYIEEVTGENYQMVIEDENSDTIIDDLEEEEDQNDFNDADDGIDDMGFDVLGEDKNEFGVNLTEIEEDELIDLPKLDEEDLVNSDNELSSENENSFSKGTNQDDFEYNFADGDLSPLSFKGKHVLIFNMAKVQSELLERYLSERIGMEVDFVTKKHNLWRHLKIDPLELVILESGTKGDSDALEIMQQTKDQFPEVKFICISGPVSLERRIQFINAGALDYLTRPIHLSTIAQSILINLSQMDFYKKENGNENFISETKYISTEKQNIDSAETFHDEDLTDNLELSDIDIDVSREIELVDEDF